MAGAKGAKGAEAYVGLPSSSLDWFSSSGASVPSLPSCALEVLSRSGADRAQGRDRAAPRSLLRARGGGARQGSASPSKRRKNS